MSGRAAAASDASRARNYHPSRPTDGSMKPWLAFLFVASVLFALVAGGGALLVPPDVLSTLPATAAGFLVAIPAAYWLVYRRQAFGGRSTHGG